MWALYQQKFKSILKTQYKKQNKSNTSLSKGTNFTMIMRKKLYASLKWIDIYIQKQLVEKANVELFSS